MTDEIRTSHPYFMYDHLQAQPAAWTEVAARTRELAHDFAIGIARRPRVLLTGIGTSFHSAQTGEYILRAFGPPLEYGYFVSTSFDFALYGPQLLPSDAVIIISHRGTKSYSLKSVQRARDAGCRTALITGQDEPGERSLEPVDFVFTTVAQEKSSAHTYSFTGSIAVLTVLADEMSRALRLDTGLNDELLTTLIPGALQTALGTEDEMAKLAREFVGRRRIWLVGGGPAAIVANEAALKINETSYLQASGIMTETMIHGAFQAVEAEDGFILIAPEGAARERTSEIAGMIQEIGGAYVVISDSQEGEVERAAAAWVRVPRLHEAFSTLTCLIPLQLFAYHLALVRGTNPDTFRRDDERFERASQRIKL